MCFPRPTGVCDAPEDHGCILSEERECILSEYAFPEVLVSTDWVKQHMHTPGVRVVEIDVDTKQYETGHIPGSVPLHCKQQLQDQVHRDIVSRAEFERLMGSLGIRSTDTIVLHGDNHNWFAAHGFWLLKYYGHQDVRIMNGGRVKWLNEDDKPLTSDRTRVTPASYAVSQEHPGLRARVADVLAASSSGACRIVDVRSPDEYLGKAISPPGLQEGAQRGGHVPGAVNVPWARSVNPDGTFKSADQLRQIYVDGAGVDPTRPAICYCRVGERSSHTWFVLKYLLGVTDVRNYDGSWTEYGNLVGVPIER